MLRKKNSIIIGIVGYSCSGKSAAAILLQKELGPDCLLIDGDKLFVGFKALPAEIAHNMSASERRAWGIKVTNEAINDKIEPYLKSRKFRYIIADWHLLPQTDLWRMASYKISVTCDGKKSVERLMKRSEAPISLLEDAKEEIQTRQRKAEPYIKNAIYDYTLSNSDDKQALAKQVKQIADLIRIGAPINRELPLTKSYENGRII